MELLNCWRSRDGEHSNAVALAALLFNAERWIHPFPVLFDVDRGRMGEGIIRFGPQAPNMDDCSEETDRSVSLLYCCTRSPNLCFTYRRRCCLFLLTSIIKEGIANVTGRIWWWCSCPSQHIRTFAYHLTFYIDKICVYIDEGCVYHW